MLFGPDSLIKRYETPQDILLEFFHVRMQFYHKRRAFLIQVNTTASHMITVNCIPRLLSCMVTRACQAAASQQVSHLLFIVYNR